MNSFSRMARWRERWGKKGYIKKEFWLWKPRAEALTKLIGFLINNSSLAEGLADFIADAMNRRRALAGQWRGHHWMVEIDHPTVGALFRYRPIGGRLMGPRNTHIELSPEQASDIDRAIKRLIDQSVQEWATSRDLVGRWHEPVQVLRVLDRPNGVVIMSDDELAEYDARLASAEKKAAIDEREADIGPDPAVYRYPGFHGYPSYCYLLRSTASDGRPVICFEHAQNQGTSPTNMIEDLATDVRKKYYPEIPPENISWFEWYPHRVYRDSPDSFAEVRLEWNRREQRYADPSWEHSNKEPLIDSLVELIAMRRQKHADDAFQPRNDKQNKLFSLAEQVRRVFGPMQCDVYHPDPLVKLVVHLHTYPADTERAGRPILMISPAIEGDEDATYSASRDEIDAAANVVPIIRRIRDLGNNYDRSTPEYRVICDELGLDPDYQPGTN